MTLLAALMKERFSGFDLLVGGIAVNLSFWPGLAVMAAGFLASCIFNVIVNRNEKGGKS